MLHIIQNDPEVPPGIMIDYLAVPYSLCRADQGEQLPALGRISALIVLGGAMGAHDDVRHPFLADLKQLIRDLVVAGKPYLGICLGGQLLAAALGAQVVANRWEELGTLHVQLTAAGRSDLLFQGIPEKFTTFQWHHDSFDLPDGAVLLASSSACPHQAFRVGTNAWGLQFHPEVTEPIIRSWAAWDRETARLADRMVADFSAHQAVYRQTVQAIINNFVTCCS